MNRFFALLLPLLIVCAAAIAGFTGCSSDEPNTPPVTPGDTVSDKVRPVVFVHGYLEAADAWTPMTQLFVQNGYTEAQLRAFDFEDCAGGDNTKMAAQLAAVVTATLAQTGSDRVDIVTHGIGSEVVQRYLTQSGGDKTIAHIAFLGGSFVSTMTLNGTMTPSPLKYLAVRSNGQDATQLGNPNAGTLTGAVNRQFDGLDHQQLLADGSVFGAVYAFFTGTGASSTTLPQPINLRGYSIKGRVITFYDNLPVANATVRFVRIKKGSSERQAMFSWRSVVTDANGYFTFTDTLNPNFDLEIADTAWGCYDTHLYRQPWRANTFTERVRVLPKSGGSAFLQAIMQGLVISPSSSVALVHSPYRALHNGRDQASARVDISETTERSVQFLTAATAPPAGGSGMPLNPFMLWLFDYGDNQMDGTGPVPVSALSAYGISSFDVFIYAISSLNYESNVTLNGKTLFFKNWRSLGSSTNNRGISIVAYDYF